MVLYATNMRNHMKRIKSCMLMLLAVGCTLTNGIQVYENNENDVTTTTTTKLQAIMPTTEPMESGDSNITAEAIVSTSIEVVPVENVNSTAPVQYPTTTSTTSTTTPITPRTEKILKAYQIADRDQQHKSTNSVDQKKFVPSQQISAVGTIEEPIESKRESFSPPTNLYFNKPMSYEPYYNYQVVQTTPVTTTTQQSLQYWKQPAEEPLRHYQPHHYQTYEEHQPAHEHPTKSSWPLVPISNDAGKWYWMPKPMSTDKPKSSSNEGWKWIYECAKTKPNGIASEPSTFDPFKSYHFQHEPHPYSFESTIVAPTGPPSDTPFSYGEQGRHGGEHIFTTPDTSEAPEQSHESLADWTQYWLNKGNQTKDTAKKSASNAKKNTMSPWKKIVHVLTAAIPIGLLISALTPNVIYVDPNSTSSLSPTNSMGTNNGRHDPINYGHNHRTVDTGLEPEARMRMLANPMIDFLTILGDKGDSPCETRQFCEVSRQGAKPGADVLHRMLWKIANETPLEQASRSGLSDIFAAIRDDNCSIFPCKSSIKKQRIRRKKIEIV